MPVTEAQQLCLTLSIGLRAQLGMVGWHWQFVLTLLFMQLELRDQVVEQGQWQCSLVLELLLCLTEVRKIFNVFYCIHKKEYIDI